MGRQSGNTFRTTISLPVDLKKRMDAAGVEVNWSTVAARAFEDKLAEIAAKKKEKTMDDVIQRLRASKLRSDNEKYKEGEEAGRSWAKAAAEVGELERLETMLAKLDGEPSYGRDEFFSDDDGGGAYSAAEHLYFAIHPEYEGHRRAAEDFWESVPGGESRPEYDPSFLRGFAEGAEAFWLEVKNQL